MSKKNKIIISIVGITIVLLALLGITYAYYLTRIEGNTNTNSISLTTADLKLVYRDGNGLVTKENIMPGTTIEKTFTVENTGNGDIDNYAVYLEEITNTLTRTEDLTYVLTCESTGEDCDGSEGEFPTLATDIVTNSIKKDTTHTYKLTVTYANLDDVNQSEDMGSVISAFVQIYAMKDILDIEGEVTNASDGDFAQINSVQKRSQIVDGKYKFAGVLPGTHTIKICGKDDNVCSNETAKLSQQIVVNVGTTAGVSGNTITMTESSQTANINMNVSAGSLTIDTEIKEYNPFNAGTLAYNIYDNAKKSTNGTIHTKTPPSKVAERLSLNGANIGWDDVLEVNVYPEYEPTHYSDHGDFYSCIMGEYDEETGEEITDCTGVYDYTTCNEDVIGKYISESYYYNDIVLDCVDGKPVIGKSGYERVLSETEDDYGISYYYRGNVIDNYVDFAGMCWRIVRILGDGSIKLILEDQNTTCASASFTGNWNIGSGNYGVEQFTNMYYDTNYKKNYSKPTYQADKSMVKAFYDFQNAKLGNYLDNIKPGNWCLSDNAYGTESVDLTSTSPLTNSEMDKLYNKVEKFYYDAYVRLYGNKPKEPTLKCNGTVVTEYENVSGATSKGPMYVGTLTADEFVYAGGLVKGNNSSVFYLLNDYYTNSSAYFWTLTPYSSTGSDSVFYIINGNYTNFGRVDGSRAFRPSILLKSNIIVFGGEGTINNPYVVE